MCDLTEARGAILAARGCEQPELRKPVEELRVQGAEAEAEIASSDGGKVCDCNESDRGG